MYDILYSFKDLIPFKFKSFSWQQDAGLNKL